MSATAVQMTVATDEAEWFCRWLDNINQWRDDDGQPKGAEIVSEVDSCPITNRSTLDGVAFIHHAPTDRYGHDAYSLVVRRAPDLWVLHTYNRMAYSDGSYRWQATNTYVFTGATFNDEDFEGFPSIVNYTGRSIRWAMGKDPAIVRAATVKDAAAHRKAQRVRDLEKARQDVERYAQAVENARLAMSTATRGLAQAQEQVRALEHEQS